MYKNTIPLGFLFTLELIQRAIQCQRRMSNQGIPSLNICPSEMSAKKCTSYCCLSIMNQSTKRKLGKCLSTVDG